MADTVRIEIPIETIDETEPDLSNVTKKLDKMSSAVTKAGSSSERAREKVSRFDKSAEKTQKSLSKWVKEKYEVMLEAKERITPVLRTIGSGIKNFAGRTWRVTMKAVDLVTAPVRGILNVLKNPVFQVGAVLGVSIGLKDTIDTYKDFEAAMSQVSAVSGATGSDLEKLNKKAQEMGSTTKFTATEAAEGFNYMAMAGWKTNDMLDGIEGIMSLAAASGEDLATTSDIVTDALTAFNMTASDSGHFADVLASASSNANTNVGMLGESFKYVAPVAGAMKYSLEDISLALGLMANASVKSSMAGTSLKTAISNMSAPTAKMHAAMKKYNISLKDSKGKARDFKAVLDNLRSSLGNLSETEQTAAAKNIFGKEAMAGMLAIVNASEKDYNKLSKAINNADGASAEMADTMLDNMAGSITLFQSALDGAKLSLGKRLAPYVRSAADWLTEMMPSVESAIGELMDYVDRKVNKLRQKFQDMSGGEDWKNADFFGKVSIAWDEFIATPFKEWWSSTGKASIANVLGDFGELLGSGLNAGILTLLGFDVSGTKDEGASIGASFAKGFVEGFDFDEISSKLWDGFKNLLSNASKLLPGGESADLSSLMSAALLAKVASPFLKLGSGGIRLGKAVFGSGGAAGGSSLAGSLLGSAGAGTGLLGFGANTAINLGAGNLAGGASLSAGALSAVGLGATAGGVAAGASLLSGLGDWRVAIKNKDTDKEKAEAYQESGSWKVGGVAAGAAAGAAIGSVVPVLGTAVGALIGAGVGGIAGWVKGNKVKEEYEENLEKAQEAAERAQKVFSATGRDIKEVKFKTKELRDAMYDTEVSAEEFAQMFQEAVVKDLRDHFGDISLSLEEVQEAAAGIVFDNQTKSIDNFTTAVQNADSSLSALQGSVRNMKKANWQVGLDEGAIDQKTYGELYQKIADGYNENIKELQDRVESFQLDSIADAYSKELDGILPDIEGTTSEKLKAAMDQALAIEPEPANWANEDISKWFGLDKLDTETQNAISGLLKQTAESIPDSVANALHENLKQSQLQSFQQSLNDPEYDTLFLTSGTRYGNSLTTGASNSILAGASTLRTSAQSSLNTAFADPFTVTANVSVTPNYNFPGINDTVKGSLSFPGINDTVSGSDKASDNSGSGSPKPTRPPEKKASGGYVAGKQLSWLAEEGYGEWVIPTAPGRRARALELYKQAGRSLGVQENADGGFVSQYGSSYGTDTAASNDLSYSAGETVSYHPYSGESGSGGDTNIELNVTVNPEFTINGAEGQDSEDVVEVIRRHIREIADEVGGEIASQLNVSFSNRPLKEA